MSTSPPSHHRSVAIVTLGCGRNEVDSDQLAGLFHRAGAEVIDDAGAAEVVLVNTCTFIDPAKQESIDTVLEACQLKDDGTAQAVLVVGCMAQRYPHELAEAIPEADAIVGFDGYSDLPAIVDDVVAGRARERVIGVGPAHPGSRSTTQGPRRDLPLMVGPPSTETPSADGREASSAATPARAVTSQDELDRIPASGPRFPVRHLGAAGAKRPWSYLKIASGCDRVCTFCAIPSFRGRFRSRPVDEVVAEAAWLADQGVRELVLVSENTTSYGKDLPGGRHLQPRLLHELAAVDGIERLRLMYLQPAELTDELLEAIATEPKVASYYDLSLQHVSAPIIARMARSGDHERFAALIEQARQADPDAVFRSNFIVGFPGETEHDVTVLERFLEQQQLDWVGLFGFSREDGTPSAQLPDQVPEPLAHERLARISQLQERVADDAARRFVGRELEVLVDEIHDDPAGPVTLGRSYREAPDTDGEIRLHAPDGSPAALPVGRVVTARVTEAVGVDLVATVEPATAGGSRG
ncbi:MAG: 30S ribosomal protein S12 methylthiotransferase RimO [Nitriliruptoraceae bacterium]